MQNFDAVWTNLHHFTIIFSLVLVNILMTKIKVKICMGTYFNIKKKSRVLVLTLLIFIEDLLAALGSLACEFVCATNCIMF